MAKYVKKTRSSDPSYKRLKADYFPVVRSMTVASGGSVVGRNQLLDVGRMLSVFNHRLYRQGKRYHVKVDFTNASGDANADAPRQIEVFALADTWMNQKAWQMARGMYEDAMADERSTMGEGQSARWEDFRVNAGVPGLHIMQPYRYDVSLNGAPDAAGEFVNSQVIRADGTAMTFTYGASGGNTYGILEEYDKYDNTAVVNATNDGAYANLMNENDEAAADLLKTSGDQPPYDRNSINTSPFVKVATLTRDQMGSQRLSTGFFAAPCGLVIIRTSNNNHTLTDELTLTVKAGDYKGVSADNMGV